jgi:hypothetical protein
MSTANPTQEDQAVSIMKAASIANVHISTIYKLRSKPGAFKRDDVWNVPMDSLRTYIQERTDRAHRVLEESLAVGSPKHLSTRHRWELVDRHIRQPAGDGNFSHSQIPVVKPTT